MSKRFFLHAGGAAAPLFAIAAIPMFAAVGAAVDFSRAYQERTVVQDALDAAALSGGKIIGGATNEQIKEEVELYYYNEIGTKLANPPPLEMDVVGGTITLTTTLHVPTLFLRIMGLDEIVFQMKTAAKAGMGTIEVVLALDNSGSMSGSKISTLRDAATELTNKLYALAATSTQPDPVKMGVVPFAASVNVGPQYANAAWMDTGSQNPYHADSLKNRGSPSTTNNFTLFTGLKNSAGQSIAWMGCVEERPAPYDADDTPAYTGGSPTSEQRKTIFVPLFAPDEPDNWTCTTGTCSYSGTTNATRRYNGVRTGSVSYNNYLPDSGSSGTCGPTVTMTSANPAVFTSNGHGLAAGTEIAFQTSGSLYSGITAGTPYYVTASGLTANTFRLSPNSSSTTFTVATGSPAVFTSNGHGLTANTAVVFSTTGSLPSGITAGNTYYVISSGLTSNNFRVSATQGGSAISASGGQSGTHSWLRLVGTSGSQSGTHTFTKTAEWTCQSGNANCAGTNNGKSEASGFAGLNVTNGSMCKYGTPANKAVVSNITVAGLPGGPNFMCTTPPLQPLTTDKNLVLAKISQMQAQGATNILSGAAWGWRLLSPGEPFTEGRAYDATDNTKFLILMTDGANTYYPQTNSTLLKSWYGAFGYVAEGHLGTTSTNANTLADAMNERTIQACNNMKAAGIVIFTVGFDFDGMSQAEQARALEIVTQCASGPDKYYTPNNNGDLMNAFSAIGDAITSLRVSM